MASACTHRVHRPRGGSIRRPSLDFREAVQLALWDLAAKQADPALWRLLGATRARVPAYASGLDFHLDDAAFCRLFETANDQGYQAFKIKVGHPDFAHDLHRLDLLRQCIRPNAQIMIDAIHFLSWAYMQRNPARGKVAGVFLPEFRSSCRTTNLYRRWVCDRTRSSRPRSCSGKVGLR